MDVRYEAALRTATQAWAKNQTTDALTLRTLRSRAHHEHPLRATAADTPTTPTAPPTLARFGNLGTRLNVYA